MTKRRLMRRFKRVLNNYAPRVADRTGLPQKPFTLVWTNDTPVAAAGGGIIYLNYENWFKAHPDDYGALVHEYVHIIQEVPGGTCPGDVIEGIADAVRYIYGLFDPSWWSPTPTARKIAELPLDCFQTLARGMAAGTYDPAMLECT